MLTWSALGKSRKEKIWQSEHQSKRSGRSAWIVHADRWLKSEIALLRNAHSMSTEWDIDQKQTKKHPQTEIDLKKTLATWGFIYKRGQGNDHT